MADCKDGVCMEHSGVLVEVANLKEKIKKVDSLEEAVLRLTYLVEKMEAEQVHTEVAVAQEKFWTPEVKRDIIKWGAITVMFIAALLVGTNVLELAKVIPSVK